MRKRVGLARAFVLEPQILLYDEPTTGLDPVATKNVDDMIRDISKETGVTSVVISHDMASTFRIADRISMLYEGKIVDHRARPTRSSARRCRSCASSSRCRARCTSTTHVRAPTTTPTTRRPGRR